MSNDTQVQAHKAHMALVYEYADAHNALCIADREAIPAAAKKHAETMAAVEASARQLAEQGAPILTITGYQLREALEFLAPDGEAEQLEQSVCIQRGPERTHDEGTDPAGLYCWLDDCPEEGSIPLTGDDARIIEATKPQQGAPGFVMVQSPITEDMHVAAVKVLHRSNGVDGLPQRMLDAMLAARPLTASPTAPSTEASEPVGERDAFEIELRRQCFQKPTPEAYDLAWSMWKARASKGTP